MAEVWKELQFHPLIQEWFSRRYGEPTDIQKKAWQSVQSGDHVLLTAPTGSGKTLASFLWSINQLITGAWPCGSIRVLYISPLKALNNDIRLNLLEPLEELTTLFQSRGVAVPPIHVFTRSGDTPQNERQRMLRHPPEILITTPESFNLILSSKKASPLLNGTAVCIIDEVHAIAGNKRGTHLITAVERLAASSGGFQRIGLSASVRPLEKVADFIGGYSVRGTDLRAEKRKVIILTSRIKKRYTIKVSFPDGIIDDNGRKGTNDSRWPAFIDRFIEIISANQSTLFFANSRRLTEKITLFINEKIGYQAAYSHHGSLSREIRSFVEEKLKKGALKAIVATSSLELGIDVGKLDRIILIQSPFSITSALQRIGRGGHTVNVESVGEIYPLHGMDFPVSAVIARAVVEQDIEEIHIPDSPLDILAQIVISMAAHAPVKKQDLLAIIRASYSYRNLSEEQFERILEMLAGKYADSRIRELNPRISYDKIDNTIQAKPGAVTTLYMSGGTIPDRGYFDLRISDSLSKVGELDEEFVWERSVGDTFTLGTQSWRITRIDHQKVEVLPASGSEAMAPFWKGENTGRDFHLSSKISLFLSELDTRLNDPNLPAALVNDYFMDRAAADELIDFLIRQKEHTETALPGRFHLLVEHFNDPFNNSGSAQVILHTLWGGKINAPYAVALSQAWFDTYRFHLNVYHDDDCIMLNLPHEFRGEMLLNLVTVSNLEVLLRKKLESTGMFGARFRENAARALLLPKASFKHRMPLWLNRLRAKKLLQAVSRYEDFPIIAETWRTCLQDEFDIPHLKQFLDELADGTITVTEAVTRTPSPFASNIIWRQTDQFMYEDDTPIDGSASSLREDIIKEVMFSSPLRPVLPAALVKEFTAKLQRTYPGYPPVSGREFLDWVKERLFIPDSEWDALETAIDRMEPGSFHPIYREIEGKVTPFSFPGSTISGFTAKEVEKRIRSIADNNADIEKQGEILLEWLRFYGPVPESFIRAAFGIGKALCTDILSMLQESGRVIIGKLTDNSTEIEVCDSQNLEFLLRLKRKNDRPDFKPLPLTHLPLFSAEFQGLTNRGNSIEHLQERLEQLMGYPAAASLWESEFIPARLDPYYCSWLDTLFAESDLLWYGNGKEKIGFCFSSDTDLFLKTAALPPEAETLFPDPKAKYSFRDMKEQSGMNSDVLAALIWKLAWKGQVSNDGFSTLRRGIDSKFKISNPISPETRGRRSGFNRWKSSKPITGNWYLLQAEPVEDMLEKEEIMKDRARQLLLRYGILFRECLAREDDLVSWKHLFRSLRLMELSGEIVSGYFFENIPGPQFISHQALRTLRRGLPENSIYWMNAQDPASQCGLSLEHLKEDLPRRLPSNHIVYHGSQLVLISEKLGTRIRFLVPPDNVNIPRYLSFFRTLVSRDALPVKSVKIMTVNDIPVEESPYSPAIESAGFTRDYKTLVLRESY